MLPTAAKGVEIGRENQAGQVARRGRYARRGLVRGVVAQVTGGAAPPARSSVRHGVARNVCRSRRLARVVRGTERGARAKTHTRPQ